MTLVGREAVASGKQEMSLLDQREFPPTGCWIVRGHGWWSSGGGACRELSWHLEHSAWEEFLYFLQHARTGSYITGALWWRVKKRSALTTIEKWPLGCYPEWFWEELLAIEWTHRWIPCPKLVVWGEEPIEVQNTCSDPQGTPLCCLPEGVGRPPAG